MSLDCCKEFNLSLGGLCLEDLLFLIVDCASINAYSSKPYCSLSKLIYELRNSSYA